MVVAPRLTARWRTEFDERDERGGACCESCCGALFRPEAARRGADPDDAGDEGVETSSCMPSLLLPGGGSEALARARRRSSR
jgi:hypothetical protein